MKKKMILNGQLIELGGASGSTSGYVDWENINGRPDLSDVSSMKVRQITLLYYLWVDNEQSVSVDGILEDENSQLIIPIPVVANEAAYKDAGILCVEQQEGGLVFRAGTVPEEDIAVNVFILEAASVSEVPAGEFEWWSPLMTSNNTPAPYKASASSEAASCEAYHAFNKSETTADGTWTSKDEISNAFIEFDFGKPTAINGIQLTAIWITGANEYYKALPKTFSLLGSNNDEVWKLIYEEDGSKYSSSGISVVHEYEFNPVAFRYYKIVTHTVYEATYNRVCIQTIRFNKLKEAE